MRNLGKISTDVVVYSPSISFRPNPLRMDSLYWALNSLSSGSSLSSEATYRASSCMSNHEHRVSKLVSAMICWINSSFFSDSNASYSFFSITNDYSASISSAVRPVYFAICSTGMSSAFMLRAAFTMSSLLASSNSSGREAHSSQSVSAR